MLEKQYDYLDESYRNLVPLGKNSHKQTFLAQDNVTGKIVVKKYISAENAELYLRLKEVRQKNLVQILQVAKKSQKALVIMEYIGGQTLEEYQKEHLSFSEEKTADYIQQLLEGLGEIHKQNIVHRDINPKNILISVDGVIKIIDFDIGRLYKAKQNCDTDILGTVGYAAPEQFGFMQSDRRTDIYAVGVLLNWMLTGKLPQERKYIENKYGKIIRTCIQIDPEKRYKSTTEILLALNRAKMAQSEVRETKKPKRNFWPGFRSDKVWKKIIALVYYFIMGFYSVVSIIECAATPLSTILEIFAVFIYIWLAVFVAFNIFGWMNKIPVIQKLDRTGRIVLGLILWLILFNIGYELEQFIRGDMLQIQLYLQHCKIP